MAGKKKKRMKKSGAPTKKFKGRTYESMGAGTTKGAANWRKRGFNARVSGGNIFVRPK